MILGAMCSTGIIEITVKKLQVTTKAAETQPESSTGPDTNTRKRPPPSDNTSSISAKKQKVSAKGKARSRVVRGTRKDNFIKYIISLMNVLDKLRNQYIIMNNAPIPKSEEIGKVIERAQA
jgi:hypothetical protein